MPRKRTGVSAHGDERRAALLRAVTELVEESGYHGMSIGAIAARAGVGRSAFYFYFATKAAAVAAVLEGLTADLVVSSAAWYAGREAEPRERIRVGMEAAVEMWRTHPALWAAMYDAAATDRDVAQLWNGFWDGLADLVAVRLEQERAAGLAAGGPPVAICARTLVGMNFRACERDVRQIVATGKGDPGLAWTLSEIWARALYGVSG